jgi:hypothetical protein
MEAIKMRALITLGTFFAALGAPALTSAQAIQPGRAGVTADIAVVNQYMFRGVRQNVSPIALWPAVDVRVSTTERSGMVRRFDVHGGFWNSLHTGDTGAGGPAGNAWYESDLYGSFGVRFARGLETSATYTAYRSPNDLFTTVNEMSVKLAIDDGSATRAVTFHPYALAAFEFDTSPGVGQVDGGARAGRYLELGAAPTRSVYGIAVAVPIKVGLSIGNYYELARQDHPFGFLSVGVGGSRRITQWLNVHGGVEYQHLGTTTKAFNGGEASATIASIGVGFSR